MIVEANKISCLCIAHLSDEGWGTLALEGRTQRMGGEGRRGEKSLRQEERREGR
jgi:hypothetical protein